MKDGILREKIIRIKDKNSFLLEDAIEMESIIWVFENEEVRWPLKLDFENEGMVKHLEIKIENIIDLISKGLIEF